MTTLAIGVFWGTVGFVAIQAALVALFVRKLSKRPDGKSRNIDGTGHPSPDVGIILCVRGCDPSLENCLQALLQQEFDRYRIFVVGDSSDDPGVVHCQEMASQHSDKIQILINDEILPSCGLKCSNLIYAVRQLESQFELFLLVDADTVPPPNWLESMVAPFENPKVGVTTGIRWFDVQGSQLGTWVRYIWNTAAIVQMVCYKIPWGGSLGIRTSFLRDADILDAWSRGFCEDTMLQSLARRFDQRIDVVPEAVISSSEQTTFGRCVPWISRQLLTARLHHPGWVLVLSHGLSTAFFSFVPLLIAIGGAIMASVPVITWSLASYVFLQVANVCLLNWIESPIRGRHKTPSTLSRDPFLFLVSMMATQVGYVVALTKAVFVRQVEWRQIWYRIRGRRVEMREYQPYQEPDSELANEVKPSL